MRGLSEPSIRLMKRREEMGVVTILRGFPPPWELLQARGKIGGMRRRGRERDE